jgi:hypothetical protein
MQQHLTEMSLRNSMMATNNVLAKITFLFVQRYVPFKTHRSGCWDTEFNKKKQTISWTDPSRALNVTQESTRNSIEVVQ